MRTADLEYELPKELIAQRPPDERDAGRLLVVEPGVVGPNLLDERVRSLPSLLPRPSLLVVNDTRVVAARLLGRKASSGGNVEIFLLRRVDDAASLASDASSGRARYKALTRASKPLRVGAEVELGSSSRLFAVIASERAGDEREIDVVLGTRDGSSVEAAIEAEGHVPLPPYVERSDDQADRERYQTVFAQARGAVAAPTAGLHFSDRLLTELRACGHEVSAITLHVGLGTFAPVTVDDLDDHAMHEEAFSISAGTCAAITSARERGMPVVAVGTTVVRALESAADPARPGCVTAVDSTTKILIQPGFKFSVVDHLITNFHLPRSTLLALVSAFAGREAVRVAYEHAVRERYRFFSYGDAMLLTRAVPAAAQGEEA